MEREKMICCKCKKEIIPGSNYHENIEYNNGEVVRVDYIHQKCWEEFTLQTNQANRALLKSNYMLNALGNFMQKNGILPDMEVVI
jgi:hypothetical protein